MPEQEQNQRPTAENREELKDAPLTAGETATETTGQARDQRAAEETKTESRIFGLRTLKSDVSAYVKEKGMSLIDVAAEISERRRFGEETTTQTKKTLLLGAGIFLLIAGLGIGTWLILKGNNTAQTELLLKAPKSLILSDKQKIITLKSESQPELIGLIQQEFNSSVNLGTIFNFPILLETPKDPEKSLRSNGASKSTGQTAEKNEFLTAQRFLEILGMTPPVNLTQSLEGSFNLGIFYFKKNNPFLIFRVNSFDLAFSGVLGWEKSMARDLKEVMAIQTLPPETRQFQDKVIQNHDTRILYDNANNPVLIYAFFEKNYLIITSDSDTFEEIIRRFNISPPAN